MENYEHILLLLMTFSCFLLTAIAGANDHCSPASCGPNEPEVRFPFRILRRQPVSCGYPGFDLSCNELNQTIIQIPLSLSYIVKEISYVSQVIYIDLGFCRPNGIVSIDLTGTPFNDSLWRQSYTFYNCSLQNYSFMFSDVPFPCLSTGNYSVIASPGYMTHRNCTFMKSITVPVRPNNDIREVLILIWFTPYFRSCERDGKACGLKSEDGDTICVTSSRRKGILRSAKYGLIIGIGLPALLCIIGLVCYASSQVLAPNDSLNQSIDLPSVPIIPQTASRMGLDRATIESYPKTVLEDIYSLPNDDGTCAICICDYKSKELLRTIPQCNHYFHLECIDEWLKLNGTCPVCRNTQQSSALVIPSSSASVMTSVES